MQKGSESLARKVLDLAEQQGLLEPKAIAELRQQVTEIEVRRQPRKRSPKSSSITGI